MTDALLGLADRKERKRLKRAIVRSPGVLSPFADNQKEDEPLQNPPAAKAKKKKPAPVPAGLALMHGFSSTNVGKNRLTVRGEFVRVGVHVDQFPAA